MISVSNTTAQTLQPGQSITFDRTVNKWGCSERNRNTQTSVRLCRNDSIYEVAFSGNIGSATAGTSVQIAIALSGEALNYTTMLSTSAAANNLNNVATQIPISTGCGDFNRVSIINNGTTPVIIGANSLLYIRRVA